MVKYLSMDGVDDYLATPSIANVTEIIMEASIKDSTSGTLWNARNGNDKPEILWDGTKFINTNGTINFTTSQTGSTNPAYNIAINKNQKTTIRSWNATSWTTSSYNFGRTGWSNSNYLVMDVYDIKLYNGATLLAHYAMSTGTVQDQSGNGYHATLTGGTWMDDGTGGTTGTAYTKSLSDSVSFIESLTKQFSGFKSLADSVSSSDSIRKRLSVAIIDTVATSETENEQSTKQLTDTVTGNDSLSKSLQKAIQDSLGPSDQLAQQGGNNANLSDYVTITDTIRKALVKSIVDNVSATETDSERVSKSLLDSLTQSDTFTVTKGKAVILSDSLNVTDNIIKSVNRLRVDSISSTDAFTKQSVQSVRLYDVIVTEEQFSKFLPNAPSVIGTIQLKGSRDLYVYLLGSRDLIINLQGNRESTINLKGGVNVTVYNQNFVMESGDSKILNYAIGEELTGATLSWEMYRRGESTPFVTKSGNSVGNAVQVTLVPEDTAAIKGTYAYELKSVDQQNYKSTLAKGVVTLE